MSAASRRRSTALGAVAFSWLLGACAGRPPPDWQINARADIDGAVASYLAGDQGQAARGFAQARAEIARSGRVDLLARAELIRCAARVASLETEPCDAFEALRGDATEAERAYADYLAGRVPSEVGLLPTVQRDVAKAAFGAVDPDPVTVVRSIDEPLSRLVAAAVLFRSGRASPGVIAIAIDAASSQGWRRPLLAWLGLQAMRAEHAGDLHEAERLRRRAALVANPG